MRARIRSPRADLRSRCRALLQDQGVWHRMSSNPPVGSCAEAANQRQRLGHVGIPLCDELKSLVYVCRAPGEEPRYVLLHCRGHQRLDVAKCAGVLGAPVELLDDDELWHVLGAVPGAVTPFAYARDLRVRHVVDDTVLAPYYSPFTMMTNAGDLRTAVEFRPADLVRVLPGALVADIVVEEHKHVPKHVLGIVTGNAPESGMLLWQKINDRIRNDVRVRARGDADFPRVVIESVPGMGASMELAEREQDVRPIVLDAVERLCASGVTVVALACNTTQYFAQDIESSCSRYGARFLSIPAETAAFLRRAGVSEVDFLAIEPVIDDRWSDFRRALGDVLVHVPDRRQLDAIAELAFRVKQQGVTAATVNRLRDVVHGATRTDTVVLALTELSIVLSAQRGSSRSGKHFVDTLDVLAAGLAEVHLRERVLTGGA